VGIYVSEQHIASIFSKEDGGSTLFQNTGTHLHTTWCHTTEKYDTDTATPTMKLMG
jgi:hypothetical protein